MHRNKPRRGIRLFDHLVGAADQCNRKGEANRLGGLKLMISSTLVDSIIGRSVGSPAVRIRSM
jgi:hypothetical protein